MDIHKELRDEANSLERNLMTNLESIRKHQKTIDLLLEEGNLIVFPKVAPEHLAKSSKWLLEPIYESEDCSMGFVHVAKKDFGPCGNHVHPESKEFLIVVKGSVMLNLNGSDIRILKVGDVATIDKGQEHFSRPLEDDTKIAYVCVPNDPYLKGVRNVIRKDSQDVSTRPSN